MNAFDSRYGSGSLRGPLISPPVKNMIFFLFNMCVLLATEQKEQPLDRKKHL